MDKTWKYVGYIAVLLSITANIFTLYYYLKKMKKSTKIIISVVAAFVAIGGGAYWYSREKNECQCKKTA